MIRLYYISRRLTRCTWQLIQKGGGFRPVDTLATPREVGLLARKVPLPASLGAGADERKTLLA